ncbi:MAG: hypothetical protein HY322_20140 [Betaproteobacteria bacterium]|nr:hypothetical protein [Betaproteobacteria bacterium]
MRATRGRRARRVGSHRRRAGAGRAGVRAGGRHRVGHPHAADGWLPVLPQGSPAPRVQHAAAHPLHQRLRFGFRPPACADRGRRPLRHQGRHIEWKIAALPKVTGDAALLKQVLANLLGNEVKYTRPREAVVIEIGSVGEENGRLVLFVRDNGVGFDMQYADKLFGVFQRLHRADQFEGTGIGLANVRRIIARHGGRVWAEAAPDQGAAFYFTLKRVKS